MTTKKQVQTLYPNFKPTRMTRRTPTAQVSNQTIIKKTEQHLKHFEQVTAMQASISPTGKCLAKLATQIFVGTDNM